MKKKRLLSPCIFIFLYIAVLFSIVMYLSKDTTDKRSKIIELEKRVKTLKYSLDQNKNDMKRIELLKFKEKVVKKKYPLFSKISEVVYKKSLKYDVNPDLVLALIEIESSFKPFAVSSQGAYGLMQINYKVWKNELHIDSSKIFNIDYNVDLGVRILKMYLSESRGDIMRALHLYNNGYLYNNEKYKYKVISTVFF